MNHTQILSGGVMTRQLWMNALNAAQRTVQLEVAKMESQLLDECGYPCTTTVLTNDAAKDIVASPANTSLCVFSSTSCVSYLSRDVRRDQCHHMNYPSDQTGNQAAPAALLQCW